MNKREAAEFLGKTERAVERYAVSGKLSVRYKPGKTRPVADYDEGELAKLKHDLENPSDVRPLVTSPDAADSPTPTNAVQLRQTTSQALERQAGAEGIAILSAAIRDALQGRQTPGNATGRWVSVELKDKLTLSFKEASRLSGVPESHLRIAYADGKLRGAKIGRGVRVSPDALKAYVAKILK
jgi:excisionase family DNA binding protein